MTPAPLTPDDVTAAWRLAAEAHAGQRFPGTELPYLVHISMVAGELSLALMQEPAADGLLSVLCAILHDAVEDTAVTTEQLAARFGPAVAAGVDALTKRPFATKAEAMADSLQRIQAQPHAIWKVKLADRVTNLQRPPAHWSRAKAAAYLAEAETILQALGDASPTLAARLRARMAAYPAMMPDG